MIMCHHAKGAIIKISANTALCLLAYCLPILSPATLSAAELPGGEAKAFAFEARLASINEVEGWESVPGPWPEKNIWIAPEATLTNVDVAESCYELRDWDHAIGLLLTEDGALKLARLTKAHIGEPVALMIDGKVMSAPRIMAPLLGGRASIHGNFTEEEARAIAEGIAGKAE